MCWRDPVFSRRQIKTLKNIEYGSAYNSKTDETQKLFMDAYLPPDDDRTERPLVVYIHGGGFTKGSRSTKNSVSALKAMARRGYVSVSIDYRLTGGAYPRNS